MWRPERLIHGPQVAAVDDIPPLNRVFSEAFTDRYRRDGLVGVRVPQLNPAIWEYAVRDAGDGAMIWRDAQSELVAFNITHRSGAEGWMGPLAVRTDRQGEGTGRTIVETAIEWLKGEGVTTLGLETMPRTVDNIGFYSRLGFVPQYLTVTMTHDVTRRGVAGPFVQLGECDTLERTMWLARCRDRLGSSAPGYDFTRELELTLELGIGDTTVIEQDGVIAAFALWHSAALADVRSSDELRVLKLFSDGEENFVRLLVALESVTATLRLKRVAIRCQTKFETAYEALINRGYRVRWTDLRMTLSGYGEASLPGGEIIFSNWEV